MTGRRLALAAFALAAAACAPQPPNAILVLVDTLRADRLPCYGYAENTSPALCRLAERGLYFETARSQAPCTFPSVNSLLTSRYPAAFLRGERPDMSIPRGVPAIAEILRERGWRTGAVSASGVVRSSPGRFNPDGGYGRGFELFDESCELEDASCVNQRALSVLDELRADGAPFFLYLHYMDPHDPYLPREFVRGEAPVYTGRSEAVRRGSPLPEGSAAADFAEGDVAHLSALYDAEIAYFDLHLERLLGEFEARGVLADSLLVLASDHGEEFAEHGEVGHCRTLFEHELRVPLVFAFPGVRARGRTSGVVQNLDIVPTLLDYLGVPAEGLGLEGRSLRPLIERGEAVNPYAFGFSLAGPQVSIADERYKLVSSRAHARRSLFDLELDPGEHRDAQRDQAAVAKRLGGVLHDWEQTTGMLESSAELEARSRETRERLRALGYLAE